MRVNNKGPEARDIFNDAQTHEKVPIKHKAFLKQTIGLHGNNHIQ
jgi:hypothetical protein